MKRKTWTWKLALTEALKYTNLWSFYCESPSAFEYIIKNSLHKKAFKHINRITKWNNISAINEARKYKTRQEFRSVLPGAFAYIRKNNLQEEAYKHMKEPRCKWDKESAFKEAKKYTVLSEFKKNRLGCYKYLYRNNLLEKACSHMIKNTCMNEKKALNEAKKYTTKTELRENNENAYRYLYRNNLLEKACDHMITKLNNKEKKAMKKFSQLLKCKSNMIISEEVKIPIRDNEIGRVDFFIKIPNKNICFTIEFKHDDSYWKPSKISKQISKYNRAFRERKGFMGTYLVSPKGKYGFSEKEFVYILDHLEKTGEMLLPNSINYVRNKIKGN